MKIGKLSILHLLIKNTPLKSGVFLSYFVDSKETSIRLTKSAPAIKTIPAINNIAGIDLPTSGKIAKLATDAMICGKQILPLKRPKYEPSCLPFSAEVSIANGIEFIVIQPIPIKINERIRSSLELIKKIEIKPKPPIIKPKRYIIFRWLGLDFERIMPQTTAAIACTADKTPTVKFRTMNA